MIDVKTEYSLDDEKRVTSVIWSTDTSRCTATISEADPELYTYTSDLDGDDKPVEFLRLMSLAECILAANVHVGLIPPQNFEPISCINNH